MFKTVLPRFVLALAGYSAAGAAQDLPQKPVKLEVRAVESSINVGERTSVRVRLLDAGNQLVAAKRDLPVEILRRVNDGAKQPIANAVIRRGETQVEIPLPAASESGLTYLWARNPELMLGGAFVRVKKAKSAAAAPAKTPPSVRPSPPDDLEEIVVTGSRIKTYQVALRYSPERPFLANGKDRATIHAFVVLDNDSDSAAPLPGFRLNFFDGSGRMLPKPMVIPPGASEGTAELTYDHEGTVKVQMLSATPPLTAQGSRELEIHFDPPISGIELTANPREASLVDTADLVATLVDETGKPIPTHEARVITFTRTSGRGEIEKEEVTIEAGKAEARTRFTPTWWGLSEIVASTPNLMRSAAGVNIFPPWGLLGISLFGGLAGAGMFLLKTPAEKRWRIPVGALAGLTLFWAALFFGLAGLSRTVVLNPISVFIISMAGGWAGPRIFDFVLDHLMPAAKDSPAPSPQAP